MSEVERYWIDPSRLVQEGWHQDDTCVVKDWAYDRIVAERDELQRQLDHKEQQRESELRNGQAGDRLVGELQQRLTAADERRDVLVGLLRDMRKGDHAMISSFYGRIDAALKPAEVSDESCEFCKGWGFRANSETGADEGCGACNGTGSTPSEDQP